MTIEIRPLAPGDVEWLATQHAEAYARDEGFDETFGTLVRGLLETFEKDNDPSYERAFIAWQDGQRLGSVFCVRLDESTAKLRMFFLTREARGQGLGKRMLADCMAFAKTAGYLRMQLWTHDSHRAACALYQRAGWRMVRSEPVHSFGVDLIEQGWEVDL